MTLFLKKWLVFWCLAFSALYWDGFCDAWEEDLDDLRLATDPRFLRAMEALL